MKKLTHIAALILLVISGCNDSVRTVPDTTRYHAAINESGRLVDSLLQQGRTPGIDVAVSIHGELVWSEGFGYADLEHQVPVKPGETRFRIGSVSKPITAAAVGRLMDLGKIDIHSPIQRYVPYFPEKDYTPTVAQVAGHTAGIRHYKNREYMLARKFETVREGLEIFMDDPLLFEPGTQYFYSSYGFNLLSAAVEGASGHNFLSFMQSEVFDPLGMTSTCADKTDSIILDRTSFYALKEDSVFINAPYVDNSYKWAGGGFISTTRDLIKFGQAHLKPGFLTAETLEKLTSSQELSNGKPTGYGMGWFIREINDKRIIFHGGGSIGGISDFVLYPEDEMVIVMLSNSSHTRYGNVMEKIAELFLESTNK